MCLQDTSPHHGAPVHPPHLIVDFHVKGRPALFQGDQDAVLRDRVSSAGKLWKALEFVKVLGSLALTSNSSEGYASP